MNLGQKIMKLVPSRKTIYERNKFGRMVEVKSARDIKREERKKAFIKKMNRLDKW